MSEAGPWRRLFRLPFAASRVERLIDEELDFHLESRIADLVRQGTSEEEARRVAAREFGDVRASRAELAEVDRRRASNERRSDWWDTLRQDLSYAVRGLRRQPGFAAMIVVTLSLAIGANATIFSLVDRLMLRPPPGIDSPSSMRRLYANFPASDRAVGGRAVNRLFSYPEFTTIRETLAGTARVAAYAPTDSTDVVSGSDTVVAAQGFATADFLPMLGVRLRAGRFFSASEDDVVAPENVAVIAPRFARRLFGDESPLGRTLTSRGRRHIIIGVLSPDFHGIDVGAIDFWTPFSTRRPVDDRDRQQWYRRQEVYIPLVVRLDSAIADEQLEARATAAYRRAWTTKLKPYQGREVLAGSIIGARGPMPSSREVSISTRLVMVSGIVLLVACANVANLLLLRAVGRRREIAVRLSLGVSRARLIRQFLVESGVLAGIAGVAAVVISLWVGGLLRIAILPRVNWVGSPVTVRLLGFTAIATILSALLAGLLPALLAARCDVADALRSGLRTAIGRGSRLREGLPAAQVALSLVLIAGAGLFVASLRNVRSVDLGYDTERLVLASLYHPDGREHPELRAVIPQIAERLASMPGVEAATYSTGLPLDSWIGGVDLFTPGRDSAIADIETAHNGVSAAYFHTTGTRIVAGRGFVESDMTGDPVMIVSRRLAAAAWPRENPIGKCLMLESAGTRCFRVVGVAEDVHQFRIIEEAESQFYLPISQLPRPWYRAIVARVGDGTSTEIVAATLGRALRDAFPTARVTSRPATEVLAPQLRPWRLGAQLFTAIGVLALLVAAIGLYSVVAFGVQQRTFEIGVRLALGAARTDLIRLVIGQTIVPIAAGVAGGIAAALLAGRFVASLLYGIGPRDPGAIATAALILLAAGFAASVGPARRAMRLDPAEVLRAE